MLNSPRPQAKACSLTANIVRRWIKSSIDRKDLHVCELHFSMMRRADPAT
jgi:hypothetical protein